MADGMEIALKSDLFDAVLTWFACYYSWDLAYPRAYQIVYFLSVHVLMEPCTVRKSTSFVKLEKLMQQYT